MHILDIYINKRYIQIKRKNKIFNTWINRKYTYGIFR